MFAKHYVITLSPHKDGRLCERKTSGDDCESVASMLVSMSLPMSDNSGELGAYTVGWRYCFHHALTFIECVPGRWDTINDLVEN